MSDSCISCPTMKSNHRHTFIIIHLFTRAVVVCSLLQNKAPVSEPEDGQNSCGTRHMHNNRPIRVLQTFESSPTRAAANPSPDRGLKVCPRGPVTPGPPVWMMLQTHKETARHTRFHLYSDFSLFGLIWRALHQNPAKASSHIRYDPMQYGGGVM